VARQPAPSASGNPLLLPVLGSWPVTAPGELVGVACWTRVDVASPGGEVGPVAGLVVGGTVNGTDVEPCSPNVVVVLGSVVVVVDSEHGTVVVVGGCVVGTVLPCSPRVVVVGGIVVVVDSVHGGAVVVVVGASVVVVGGNVDVEPCSPRVVVVVGAPVVVVGAAVVVVGGNVVVVVVVVVVVDETVVVVQSEIRSTDVRSSSVTPSDHDECTRNVMVPVEPAGTVVVANVVSPSSIGDLYPVTGYDTPLSVAVALSIVIGSCTTLTA
jgi:hypothetical protein